MRSLTFLVLGLVQPAHTAMLSPLTRTRMARIAPTAHVVIRMLDESEASSQLLSASSTIVAPEAPPADIERSLAETRLSICLARAQSARSGRADKLSLKQAIEEGAAAGVVSDTMSKACALMGLNEDGTQMGASKTQTASPAAAPAVEVREPSAQSNAAACEGFIAGRFTAGGRAGFVFKRGPCGVGYYSQADQAAMVPAPTSPAAVSIETSVQGVVVPTNRGSVTQDAQIRTTQAVDAVKVEAEAQAALATRVAGAISTWSAVAEEEYRALVKPSFDAYVANEIDSAEMDRRKAAARQQARLARGQDGIAVLDAAYDDFVAACAATEAAEKALTAARTAQDEAEDKVGAAVVAVETSAASELAASELALSSGAVNAILPTKSTATSASPQAVPPSPPSTATMEDVLAWRQSRLGGDQWQVRWGSGDESWERWEVVAANADAATLQRADEMRG